MNWKCTKKIQSGAGGIDGEEYDDPEASCFFIYINGFEGKEKLYAAKHSQDTTC